MAGSSAVTVVRRGPPPLPPEPPPDSSLDDDRTREVVAPPRHAFDDDRTREVISPALRALDDDRTREVVAPRARLADPTYKVRAPAVEVREGPVLITVFGDDAGPGPVTAPPSALIPLDVSSEPSASLRGGPASHEPGPMTAPPSALLPPEPPSLQVPSALFTTGQKLDPAVLDEEPPRPSSAPASAPRPPPPKKLSRLQVVGLRLAAAVAIAAVLAGGFELYKRNRTTKIRAFAAEAAVALHGGGPRGVADAEAALAAAQRINPKSRAVLLGLVRARFFAVLDVDPARLPDLVASMEDAAGAGIPSAEIAFAQVLRASASNDPAGAVEMVTHHDEDPDRASDALYQLAAGAAVEAHDTPAAVERYRAAVKLDPMLLSAHIRLVRALAFTGQLKEARERIPQLMTSWPDRPDLVVLSSLVAVAEAQAAGDDTLPTLEASDPDMLPRPLRAAARVLAKSPVEAAIAKAISEAEVAPMVVLCGEAALRAGFEARAREAAQRAIEITSSYPPAYALAARVALSSGRFEEARQAALRAPADVAAEILSFIAYEAGDPTAMATAAGHRAEAPLPNPVAAGLLRLRAAAPLPKPVLEALTRSDKLWSDIVAMDAALDAGQLAIAETIAAGWTAADKHPIRAARVARLLRYQGKNAAAKDAAESAAPTVAARVEAALAAAEMASARAAALSAAERGRSVEEHWVAVLLLAREGRDGPARLLMRTLRLPLADTPLLLRTVAALALAELHIKNPSAPLFTSLAVWTENPDVARALGIRPTAPAAPGSPTAPTTPDTAPKPPLKGRLPRPTGEDPY
ncbi:MAG: hypothetical protein R3F14_18810 [Polyangiaceae bacterium]